MEIRPDALSVQIDSALRDRLSTYCEALNLDSNAIVNDALLEFLQVHQNQIDNLISGYVEMATLNVEIAEEFQICESEAYGHIN